MCDTVSCDDHIDSVRSFSAVIKKKQEVYAEVVSLLHWRDGSVPF